MLYSDFVHLLDLGHVRAARLESGTSRLYFDIRIKEPVPAAPAAATPAPAAPLAAPSGKKGAKAAASTSAPAAAAAVATASTSAAPAPAAPAQQAAPREPFAKHFYIKLADRSDSALVVRLLQVRAWAVVKGALGAPCHTPFNSLCCITRRASSAVNWSHAAAAPSWRGSWAASICMQSAYVGPTS